MHTTNSGASSSTRKIPRVEYEYGKTVSTESENHVVKFSFTDDLLLFLLHWSNLNCNARLTFFHDCNFLLPRKLVQPA